MTVTTENNPTLHVLCGKIASGKSTLSARLSTSPNTVIMSEDEWLASLFKDEMRSVADYVRCSGKLRNALTEHLISLLKNGLSVVLDFPANTVSNRAWMMGIVKASGANNCLHYLATSDEVCKSRLHARNQLGEHEFSASDEQFELISSYFVEPMDSEGFTIIRYG